MQLMLTIEEKGTSHAVYLDHAYIPPLDGCSLKAR